MNAAAPEAAVPEMSAASLKPWMKRAPLLPEAGAAGMPLILVIAVICFLASLSLIGFLIVSKAAASWTADLRGSVTVQVRGVSQAEINEGAQATLEFLRGTDGVQEAVMTGREETLSMLSAYNIPESLPVPALIRVTLTDRGTERISEIAKGLGSAVPSARLDDHAAWYDSLARSARTLKGLALGVFLLILATVFSVVIFATRAGLAANRDIVDVLHLVGATDMFIAKEMQRRFVILSLRGAVAGGAAAAIVVTGVALLLRQSNRTSYFIPEAGLPPDFFIWLLLVPLLTCLIAAWSTRSTVMATLKARL